MKVDTQVAIVGGAVAGTAAACAFRKAGVDVTMLEKRDLGRDPNRGDGLHASTLEVLKTLGAYEALERRGPVWLRRVTLQDWRERFRIPLDAPPPGMLMLNHAEIEAALLEQAQSQGAQIRHEAVRELRRDGSGWVVTTSTGELRASFVVGADGAESMVRHAAGIEVTTKKYTEALVVLHAPHPAWLGPDEAVGTLHPDGGLMIVPTTPAGRCRVVVIVREAEVASWLEASDAQLHDLLAKRSPKIAALEISRRGGTHLYRVSKQHARQYWRPGLALVGDAAHVTHPNGGQGMNMAIQDAEALARHLAPRLVEGEAGQEQALAAYQAERWPRNAKALDRADAGTRFQRPTPGRYGLALGALAFSSAFPFVIRRFVGALARVGG